MKLIIKKRRALDEDGSILIDQYDSEESIRIAIDVVLSRIHLLRDRVYGLSYRDFILDSDMIQLCATDFMIIGNQLGMLDKVLMDGKLRRDVYSFRSVVAHNLGTGEFNPFLLWSSIINDLDRIETACLNALEILDRADVIRFENRRPRSFRSVHPY